jgi:hypothetical protein
VTGQADAPERELELNEVVDDQIGDLPDDLTQVEASEPEPAEDELEISFGDEAAPASQGDGSDLVRHLRSEIRKRDEELAVHRKAQPPQPQTIDPGPKPTLESCDYDGDRFETELDAWKEKKAKADAAQSSAQQAAQAERERFQQRLDAYQGGKTALKAKDFDVAEAAVMSGLSPVQQAVALKAAADPAKLVYALGRHPQKLAELAKLNDPIEFAVAVSKLEGQLKVTQRGRTPPEPDTAPRGSAPLTGAKVDPHLERLEREAAKTGDRTAVVRYRREQRAKAQAR